MVEAPKDPTTAGNPRWIGPFRLLSRIGEGGMGVVWLAEQTTPLRRQVALKLMREDRQTAQFVARFEMERQALERMDHPNIARVLGAGVTDEGQPYFAMEYVPGLPIDEYCDKKKLSIDERLLLFRQVCAGAQHAHTNGIMHRDLKPSNILVVEIDDQPVGKIIDFGLARAIDVHGQRATLFEELQRIIGTLAYMSPEQAGVEAAGIDARTDVYSLGVLLYELLTGQLPFDPLELERAGVLGIRQIIKEREPVRPSTQYSTSTDASQQKALLRRGDTRTLWRQVAGELDWIVLKALQKDRTQRYETVRDFARDVERFLRHEPVEAGPPSAWYRTKKWVRRHRVGVAAGSLVAVSLIGGLVVSTAMYRDAEEARLQVQLDSDARVVEELVKRVDSLWPVRSWRAPDMKRWLADVDEVLARRDLHAVRPGKSLTAMKAAEGLEQLRLKMIHERAVAAVADLARLADTLRPEIVVRLVRAKASIEETTVVPAAAWRAASDYVAQAPLYAGMKQRLEPVEGIVPIGVDPERNLMAFYVHGTGAPPVIADGALLPRLGDAIVLLLVPPGEYRFGSQNTDSKGAGYLDFKDTAEPWPESPMQSVRLDAYWLGKYELTQDQWQRLGGTNHSQFRSVLSDPRSPLRPVEFVSWEDCENVLGRHGLSLPTEARWENACRAGTGAQWPDSGAPDPTRQVFGARQTEVIGSRIPNRWGFHDMLGNVMEWCLEGFTHGYTFGCRDGDGHLLDQLDVDLRPGIAAQTRPVDLRYQMKVLRGGAWRSAGQDSRSGFRQSVYRRNRFATYGVRGCLPWSSPSGT